MTKNTKHALNIKKRIARQQRENQQLKEESLTWIIRVLSEICKETDKKVMENQQQTQWTIAEVHKYDQAKNIDH